MNLLVLVVPDIPVCGTPSRSILRNLLDIVILGFITKESSKIQCRCIHIVSYNLPTDCIILFLEFYFKKVV